MNICVFDTETTSLEKPFCYNIGYVITDTETKTILVEKEFVCEQVWHNKMLFTTAYYSDKRPFYVNEMRKRNIKMDKFGYICREMIKDFNAFNVTMAFAYNSSFDEKVFNFNCDWFKCNNPFDNVEIKDIRGFAHQFIVNNNYKKFCEKNKLFSESGNYSTTAENVYRYISQNLEFIENHTALDDSMIENDILFACLENGADINNNYIAKRSIKRNKIEKWDIIIDDKIASYNVSEIKIFKTRKQIKMKSQYRLTLFLYTVQT